MRMCHLKSAALLASVALSCLSLAAQVVDIAPDPALLSAPFSSQDEAEFLSPQKVFYPETWFHFIGGNMSAEGIDADLQAITGAGISGIQWFHGNSFGGVWSNAGKQIRMLSPEWKELITHLARKADSLDLRISVETCPGWAMAGGPWIEPEEAMRELVWSRTDFQGGSRVSATLPKGEHTAEEWRDYRDVCVLAFPTPLGDTGVPLKPENVKSDDPRWVALMDGTEGDPVNLPEPGTSAFTFTLPEGSVIRTMELPPVRKISPSFAYIPGIHVTLKATTKDGSQKTLVDAELPRANWQDGHEMCFACNEVEDAVEYSFTMTNSHPSEVDFVRFLSAARKNSWRGEAGWTLISKEPFQQHTEQNPLAFVKSSEIVDITSKVDPSGRLVWDVPQGNWTVLRIGHVNFGKVNGPALPEATGWECDKLNPKGARKQFAGYVGMLQDGPMEGRASGMLMDSWECYTQTWTQTMEDDFKADAGYSMREYLPALMGYVVDSQEETSRFLIDWRRTVNNLYCENFYKVMTDLAHSKGMKVQYETSGGDVVTMDPMEYYKYADIPMCEFWRPIPEYYLEQKPIKPTASAAHIYGKPRVAAESFTNTALTWKEHLGTLRKHANLNMSEGVTHPVFHTYTHNPQVGFLPPGSSFGFYYGTPFLRGQTWWKYMPWFTSFIARQSYLMERGLPVVDVLWYLGDEIDHRPFQYTGNGKIQSGTIRFPEGFKYDYCNPDALLTRMSVKDGKIVTPEGISYEVLWIPENERMLPQTVEKIHELILAGARVVASAPLSPATLEPAASAQFAEAVDALWGGTREGAVNRIGKGALAVGMSIDEAVKAFGLRPHLVCDDPDLLWLERKAEGADWFFVAAPFGEDFHGVISFKAKGKAQWWNPVDGSVRTLKTRGWGKYRKVRVDLALNEGGFIVFRTGKDVPAARKAVSAGSAYRSTKAASFEIKDWSVSFPEGWGAPTGPVALKELAPWKDLDLGEEGKAFSGTATYSATFEIPAGLVGKELVLDLGEVDDVAEVKVNGESAGVIWTHPYSIPIGDLVKQGQNTVTVDVTGTWYNRLAYDSGQDEALRKTWTIAPPPAGSELLPSGLLGPVKVVY